MSTFNDVEYIDSKLTNTQWVEKISLPTYPQNGRGRSASKSVYNKLLTNYSFIKHMMLELGLQQNVDYVIVPDRINTDTITIMFNNNSVHLSSMAVMCWHRYKKASLESNL